MTIDNSSWFAPSCFPLSDDDGQVVKVRCMTTPKTVYNMGHMKKGDSFNVIIKYVDAEEMNTLGGVGEGYVSRVTWFTLCASTWFTCYQ